MTHTSTEQPSLAAIIHDLRESHARTSPGAWGKGATTHETVSRSEGREPYKVAEFRHANDAQFCDLAHVFVPRLLSEIEALQSRVQELEAEHDEADRRAGHAERHMAGLNDDVRRFEAARRRMKVQWGVHENVSFDDVWQQALDAKASQAQRVPLSDAVIRDLYSEEVHWDMVAPYVIAFARSIEAAHGIKERST